MSDPLRALQKELENRGWMDLNFFSWNYYPAPLDFSDWEGFVGEQEKKEFQETFDVVMSDDPAASVVFEAERDECDFRGACVDITFSGGKKAAPKRPLLRISISDIVRNDLSWLVHCVCTGESGEDAGHSTMATLESLRDEFRHLADDIEYVLSRIGEHAR